MRLALSSASLPGRTPADVARACGSRGLAGIEIVLAGLLSIEEARRLRELEAPVVALRAEKAELAGAAELARVAGVLEAPLVAAPGTLAAERVAQLAPEYARHGATLLVGVRTDADEVRQAARLVDRVGADSLGLAWDVRPFEDDLSRTTEILSAGEPHVLHIRLYGGGPEQRAQEGRGIGDLFVQLALSRFGGAVALTPSSDAERETWERWVTGTGPTGCGSAHVRKKPARSLAGRVELDVRPVEPKDRIDTVLGSYAGIATGGTLRLIVDHDPDCMRHLLTATQPEGSFTFEYLERGPEVWRVDVVRRA